MKPVQHVAIAQSAQGSVDGAAAVVVTASIPRRAPLPRARRLNCWQYDGLFRAIPPAAAPRQRIVTAFDYRSSDVMKLHRVTRCAVDARRALLKNRPEVVACRRLAQPEE